MALVNIVRFLLPRRFANIANFLLIAIVFAFTVYFLRQAVRNYKSSELMVENIQAQQKNIRVQRLDGQKMSGLGENGEPVRLTGFYSLHFCQAEHLMYVFIFMFLYWLGKEAEDSAADMKKWFMSVVVRWHPETLKQISWNYSDKISLDREIPGLPHCLLDFLIIRFIRCSLWGMQVFLAPEFSMLYLPNMQESCIRLKGSAKCICCYNIYRWRYVIIFADDLPLTMVKLGLHFFAPFIL